MRDLLFEIGTEELPAGFQAPSLNQLKEKFTKKIDELKIGYGEISCFATPRRLAILVQNVEEKQEDIREELLGPSKQAAFDAEGKATKAAEGFARSKGADVNDLQVVATDKGEYLMLIRELKGGETASLLPAVLKEIIMEMHFPKSMRWGSNSQAFARPIQWLIALFGDQILELEHQGIVAGRASRGHRFMDNVDFTISAPANYEAELLSHKVIADPAKRRALVIEEIKKAVAESELISGRVAIDEDLVDTCTNLVEYPYGVCGVFDEKFLQLPDEVLTTSMRVNQKYFTIVNDKGALVAGFVAVNNTEVINVDVTRKGHQRVLRARLEDALFFFEADKKVRLESRLDALSGIVFQSKLGTMAEKNDRVIKLSRVLAEHLAPELAEKACRAAQLCKADLISEMVGEFPELQGIMGADYALNDGEGADISLAIKEHYMPKRAGAELPSSDLGALVGLADRIDTIAGLFGIGQVPTGTADPFGLRRLTLAVLHIIKGRGYAVSLSEIVKKALALYGDKVDGSAETAEKILGFMKGRFENDVVARGKAAGAVEAAVSISFDDVVDVEQRIDALLEVQKDEVFAVLAASFKRICNIIKENDDVAVDSALFEGDAEKNLYAVFLEIEGEMQALVVEKKYLEALTLMLKMKAPVDAFFDGVMVMAEDMAVRQNRLNLLTGLAKLIKQIGDISKMQD